MTQISGGPAPDGAAAQAPAAQAPAAGLPRSTVVLLALGAVVVLLLYGGALAAGGGTQDPAAADTWSARLSGLGGSEVEPAALALPPPCVQQVGAVQLTGTCLVGVPAAGGFPLSGLSRRLTLRTVAGTVQLHATVRGQDVDGSLRSDQDSRVSFGRDAVTVALTCLSVGACVVHLGG